jgi:TPR repeat protein
MKKSAGWRARLIFWLMLVYTLGLPVWVGAQGVDTVAQAAAEDAADPQALAARAKTLRAAADKGDAESQVQLGIMYQAGDGVAADDAEAVKLFRKAAETGHVEGMWRLGGMYMTGNGVAKDEREALRWCTKAAKAGPADLKCRFAEMYERGDGVPQDYAEALKWYRMAAKAGNARAMSNIGLLYGQGLGVEKNDKEAADWYRKGADAGDEMGMGLLGDAYAGGWGVEKNDEEAVKWLRKAAEGGYRGSLIRLGVMYSEGRGVAQDDAEAVRWWRRAAETGDGEAMARLGLSCAQGRGVPQNGVEAAQWFLKSAQGGDVFGMKMAGLAYAEGSGMPQDLAEGVVWMQRAAAAGSKDAQEWLKTNAETLASAELRDPNSDIRFPPALGPASRGTITDYEGDRPGLGTSVGYSSACVKGTMYLYTGGAESIPDGIDSAPVTAALDEALAGIEGNAANGAYKNMSPFAKSKTALDPGTGAIPALCARFTMVQDGVAKDSAVYVFGSHNRIVKLRLTSAVAEADTARVESAVFLKAVAAWLR